MFHKLIPPTHRMMQKCRSTYPGITQMSPAGCDRFAVGPWLSLWVLGRKSRQIYDVGIQYFLHLHLFNTNSFCCLDTWSNPSWLLNILWDYFRIPRNSCLLFCDAGKVLGPVYCSLLSLPGVGGLAGAGGPSASEEWEIIRLGPCPIIDKARPTGKVRIVLDFPKTELNRTLISHKAHKSLGGSLISCNISFPNHHFIQMRWFLKIDIFFYFQLAIYQRFQFRGMRENVC